VKEETGDEPEKVLADAGYFSREDLVVCEEKKTELFIAVANDFKEKQRGGRRGAPKSLTLKQRMERKLLTKKGRKIYRNRGPTV